MVMCVSFHVRTLGRPKYVQTPYYSRVRALNNVFWRKNWNGKVLDQVFRPNQFRRKKNLFFWNLVVEISRLVVAFSWTGRRKSHDQYFTVGENPVRDLEFPWRGRDLVMVLPGPELGFP